jgi:hypothetical protein
LVVRRWSLALRFLLLGSLYLGCRENRDLKPRYSTDDQPLLSSVNYCRVSEFSSKRWGGAD